MSALFLSHPKETDLALFAGGELGPLSRWRIERHLQQCDHCQEAVADFFHLQSEVSELAETPAVDWNALAQEIGARVRVEAPAAEPEPRGWAAHPRVWQFGLATATLLCAFLIVRQLPVIQNVSGPMAPQAESQVVDQAKAVSARASEPQPAVAAREESNQPVAALQFAQEASSRDELVGEAKETAADSFAPLGGVASEAQTEENLQARSGVTRMAVPDLEAQAAPASPGLGGGIATQSPVDRVGGLAFAPAESEVIAERVGADRRQRITEGFRAAPAPARAPAALAEADAVVLQDQASAAEARRRIAGGQTPAANERAEMRSELAQAPKAETPSGLREVRKTTLANRSDADDAWQPELGFSVLPAALEDPAVDVGVAADGRISFRSVDTSTSTITITDVYVP